ncbi:MAG: peptidylprolyl isomerase [Phycisphaeraceae bacterium]|nr:peptidylprolyl isomerase [Phycisphaeraceae bacterium]
MSRRSSWLARSLRALRPFNPRNLTPLVVTPLLASPFLLGAAPRQAATPTAPERPADSAPAPQADTHELPKLSATVTTTKGPITFELHPDAAPVTVTNFCHLASNHFFDGAPINSRARVFRLMGSPWEGFDPGYRIRREFSGKYKYDRAGRVGMGRAEKANAMPTQFAITVKEQPSWNLDVPLFGTVTDGQRVVDALEESDRILKIEIIGDPTPLYERYERRIAEWNQALAKAGWTPGAPPVRKESSEEPVQDDTPASDETPRDTTPKSPEPTAKDPAA